MSAADPACENPDMTGWQTGAQILTAHVLRYLQTEVRRVNQDHGWDEPVTFGEAVALLHSEASEALEAWRQWGLEDATASTDAKPEGVGSELADVLIRLLDMCERFDVDLPAEYERKLAFNRTRPHRHGGKRL